MPVPKKNWRHADRTKESETDEWTILRNKIEEKIRWYSGGESMKSMAESFCDERIVDELRSLKDFMDAIA